MYSAVRKSEGVDLDELGDFILTENIQLTYAEKSKSFHLH